MVFYPIYSTKQQYFQSSPKRKKKEPPFFIHKIGVVLLFYSCLLNLIALPNIVCDSVCLFMFISILSDLYSGNSVSYSCFKHLELLAPSFEILTATLLLPSIYFLLFIMSDTFPHHHNSYSSDAHYSK